MKSAKALFVLIFFLAPIYPVPHSHAEPLATNTKNQAHEFYQKDRLTLVSVVQLTAGKEILGAIAAYDDAESTRPKDYLELYDPSGALLAVSCLRDSASKGWP